MPRLLCPSLALDDDQRNAFAGHLDRVRVPELVRREAPADAGQRRGASELGAGRGGRPRTSERRAADDAEQRPDWEFDADVQPWLDLLPAPVVHADLAAAAAFATTDEKRAAAWVEIGLADSERLVDA